MEKDNVVQGNFTIELSFIKGRYRLRTVNMVSEFTSKDSEKQEIFGNPYVMIKLYEIVQKFKMDNKSIKTNEDLYFL